MAQKTKTLNYEKLSSDVPDLEKAYVDDAAFDLYSMKDINLMAKTQKVIPTGIKVDIPKGYYGQILERSGISSRTTLGVKAGVIDSSYTGEIKVIMYNYGDYPVRIRKGDKIAQMAILVVGKFKAEIVDQIEKETERGEKGFGSSD